MATIAEIGRLLGVEARVQGAINQVAGIEDAAADTVVFAVSDGVLEDAVRSGAGLILASTAHTDERVLVVKDPRTAFARVYREWFEKRGDGQIHETAVIEPGAWVGEGCEIGAGAFLECGSRIGADCVIGPRVVVHCGTTLGARVRVQAGAVLGSDGFGYVREREGYFRFPQIGSLRIGADVEIGANTTIDRGALGETSVGRGTKIDNLVHIAHNCVIGEDVIIAAQVGMAGSTVVEDGAMLGGQAGLGERVTIGRGVILGGQGGVLPGKRLDGEGVVFWGTPAQPVREFLRNLARGRRK